MTKLAKLDMYDYEILPGIIRIQLSRTSDPILVDIMSDIRNSRGKIYVDGHYFIYADKYEIVNHRRKPYLDLYVTQTQSI